MSKALVIVEASGKTASLQKALKIIGIDAKVMATIGHVFDNPKSLMPIGLDRELRETAYAPKPERESLIEKIRQAAFVADRVYLAMDDDQEGDVIAWDVAKLLPECQDKLYRARLRALSEDELRRAFLGELSQEFREPACNGTCRRIVDRAIGASFSELSTPPIYTGRVQSSLLALLSERKPEIGQFSLHARVSSGEVFVAKVPVHDLGDVDRLLLFQQAVASGRGEIVAVEQVDRPASQPWGYEEVVAEASERLRIDVETASKGFQEAYERGRVSYPRARKNGFSADAVEIAAALARENRCAFEAGRMPLRHGDRNGAMPHESPRPLDEAMLLGRPLAVLDTPEAIAVLVARNVIECGQLVSEKRATIKAEGMEAVFCYVAKPPLRNWREPVAERGLHPYSSERALLRFMASHDLGRPSTIVGHVTKFLQRNLVAGAGNAPFALTEKGKAWLAHARECGFSKDTSNRMEAAFEALDRHRGAPNDHAREILRDHGMLDRVLEVVGRENPIREADCGAEFIM